VGQYTIIENIITIGTHCLRAGFAHRFFSKVNKLHFDPSLSALSFSNHNFVAKRRHDIKVIFAKTVAASSC